MDTTKIIDNNISERVIDDLKSRLSPQSRVSIAAASFSIYAFEALKKELEQVEELRFIFTSPTFVKDKSKKEKREFYNFQRDAALAIINKLEKYNGCILADNVGLGKTFTALDSLFSLGETTALRGEIKGLDDFKLICFLVLKNNLS